MELTEMQRMWTEMSKSMEEQKKITEQLVIDMSKLKYKRKFDKAIFVETIGGFICLVSGIYIIINFEKFDNWHLVLCGLLAVFVSLALPFYVIQSLINMRKVSIVAGNFKEALIDFGKAKNRLNSVRKFSVFLCIILAFVILPVCGKLLSDKDVFAPDQIDKLYFTIPFMLVLLGVFMVYGFLYYKRLTKRAEDVLLELDN
ncbi:MAG: hypothetical protein ACI8ZM_004705 [Crocinitomix sp.]|jgi:hypothetical protein